MEQFHFPFQRLLKKQLPTQVQELINAADKAALDAYAPYSSFKVGAAILLADGGMRTGFNNENASYPAGICAERSVFSTLNPGRKEHMVTTLAISYIGQKLSDIPLSPCGICRQTILETQLAQGSPIAIYMSCPDEKVILVEDASYLLPFYFSNELLNF